MSARRPALPTPARGCRCGSGAIPYVEDGSAACAKCGHALRPAATDPQVAASSGLEDRTGWPPPGPSPEPDARPVGPLSAQSPHADTRPAATLAPHAGSGRSFEWPFGPDNHAGSEPRRSGGG